MAANNEISMYVMLDTTGMLYMRHRKIRFRNILPRKELDTKLLNLSVTYLPPTSARVRWEKISLVWRVEGDPSGSRVAEFQHKPAYAETYKPRFLCGVFGACSSSGTTVIPQECDASLLWVPGRHVALASAV